MTENPSALVFGEGKKEKTTLDSYSFVRFGGFRFLLGAKNTIWPFYAQFFQGTYDCLNILATDRVLDAGANVGFFSIFAASKCQKVIAVEPNPINFRVLMLNKSMNKASNVILVNKALSDKEGYVRMSGEGVVFKISSGGVTIPAITIDSLIRGLNYDVSVVKMDIEGAEERCLEGSYLEKVR
jgi:FkbM family methyltransferase